jgi:plastocyanin
MRIQLHWLLLVAAATAAGCSSSTTQPSDGGGGPPGTVSVGDPNFFKSGHNGTQNPAIDTVAAGATVTWTWTGSGLHSVQSQGSPSFASSATQSGSGKTYAVMFTSPGTYQYDCAVHGLAMTGRIVVQ